MQNRDNALDAIRIARPCHASWDDMSGDDHARFCGQCGKHVYNLSGMTGSQAQELVTHTEGRLCVRFYRRADGTMLTAECPLGRTARPLLVVAGLAAAFLVATLGVVTAGAFMLPRLRDDGRALPGPMQTVMNWLFPPAPVCVIGEAPPVPPGPPVDEPVNPLEQQQDE